MNVNVGTSDDGLRSPLVSRNVLKWMSGKNRTLQLPANSVALSGRGLAGMMNPYTMFPINACHFS